MTVAVMLSSTRPSDVAYRGTGPAMNDLVGGHVDFLCEHEGGARLPLRLRPAGAERQRPKA